MFDYNTPPKECPKCNSLELKQTDTFEDLKESVFTYVCWDCDFQWNEVFKFESWHEVEI